MVKLSGCENAPIVYSEIVKVALFGSSGLLGASVHRSLLARNHQSCRYVRNTDTAGSKKICLSDPEQLKRELFDEWPDAVVNCAAISSPDTVNANPDLARAINVDGAVRLAEISSHLGARYVHLSTDMVFDGTTAPYRSTDLPNPSGEYGRQKLEAEKGVLAVTEESLVVLRITLMNGNSPKGNRSPHERILRSIADQSPLTLFDDEIRQPCSAENVGAVIVELLERPNLNGLFHWAGSEEISRYQLGLEILDHFGFREDRILKGKSSDYHGEEKRPRHLSFELAPLVGKLKTKPSTLRQQIEELKLPPDLYHWYREKVDFQGRYLPKF